MLRRAYSDEAVALNVRVEQSAKAGGREVEALVLARAGRVSVRFD
jgi:hypothetical protein